MTEKQPVWMQPVSMRSFIRDQKQDLIIFNCHKCGESLLDSVHFVMRWVVVYEIISEQVFIKSSWFGDKDSGGMSIRGNGSGEQYEF